MCCPPPPSHCVSCRTNPIQSIQSSQVSKIDMSRLSPADREKITTLSRDLARGVSQLSLARINYEVERIFVFLNQEIEGATISGGTGNIPLNDRLAVAEFGMIESQTTAINGVAKGAFDNVDADVLQVRRAERREQGGDKRLKAPCSNTLGGWDSGALSDRLGMRRLRNAPLLARNEQRKRAAQSYCCLFASPPLLPLTPACFTRAGAERPGRGLQAAPRD